MSIKKDRVMQELQRFGGAMYTPVILFAFFGLTVAISIVCKNTMLLGSIADKGTVWYDFWFVVEQGAWTVFAQMPILFAIAVPIGFAKKEPARCAMESFVIYMCFNYFISAFLTLHGSFFGVDYSQAAGAGTGLAMIANIKTLDMGMLGAIFIAMQKGIARGIFSNEAGLGSAPIAAAAAQTKEPVRQGLVSMTGTFLDTIVVCTMTGLALVMTGAYQIPGLEGASVTTAAFQAGLPFVSPTVVSFVLMACLALFGFTTILGWDYYGERCLEYFSNGSMKAVKVYRWLYIAAVFIGPYMTVSAVWTIADIFNACMAVPNMIALIVLSGVVVRETKDFFKRLNDAGGKEEDMVPHKNHDDVPPIDSLTDRLGAKTAQEDRAAAAQGFATA